MSVWGEIAGKAGDLVEGAVDAVDDGAHRIGLGNLTSPIADEIDSKIDSLEDTYNPVSSRTYPALGFDPAPGTVAAIDGLAKELKTISSSLTEADNAIKKVGHTGGIWEGSAATAFQGKVGELPGLLDKATQSLGKAADALAGWGQDLASMQTTARGYEKEAEEAQRKFNAAKDNPDLQLAFQTFQDKASLDNAQYRLDAAVGQVKRARDELEEIIDQAKRLLRQHHDLAERIAQALRAASDDAPQDSVFDDIADGFKELGKGIEDLAGDAWKYIQEHAELINTISTVVGDAAAVIGIVGLALDCTGLGGVIGVPLDLVAAGMAGAALAGHSLAKSAGADVSWTTIGTDAVGAIAGGRVVSKAFVAAGTTADMSADAAKALRGTAAAAGNVASAGQTIGTLEAPYVANRHGMQHTAPLSDDLKGYRKATTQ